MRLALLGYGSIAKAHVEALKTLGEYGVEFHTVMGRVEESTAEFAAEHGFARHTTDLEEAVEDPEVDWVLVASPTDVHAEQVELALRAGKHVLAEIPLATSLADTDRLTALAAELNRRLMVCHTQRYYPGLVRAREEIASGRLHVHQIANRLMFQRRENVNWVGRRRSWTDNLLWHHGCHSVDTALWLLGVADAAEPVELEVSGHLALPGQHLEIPMDLAIVVRTPADQLVNVAMSYNTHIGQNDFLIIGEETTLHWQDRRLVSPDAVLYEPPGGDGLGPESNPIANQDREFLEAVRQEREPAVSGRSVRAAMAVLQATQDALDSRLTPGARHPLLPSVEAR